MMLLPFGCPPPPPPRPPRFHLLPPLFPILLPLLLSSILLFRSGTSEKTLCERKLSEVPANNIFYYQRTEAANAVECAERCIDDWEYCKSALLVQEKGKSLCQLYGISFERLLPLNLPQITPAQTDPEKLLPLTLIELGDPPCSSKFASNSQLAKLIGPGARETLAMMPRPSAQKKFQPKEQFGRDWGGKEQKEDEGGHMDELDEDRPYLTPNPVSKLAEDRQEEDKLFRQGLPSPSFLPPIPIRPSYVSRGGGDPFGRQQQRCRNGICPPRNGNGAAFPSSSASSSSSSFHSSQETPCAARKSTDPCAPQAHWLEWTPGSCSVTCGIGSRERKRYCSSGTQSDCAGDDIESEKCIMPSCHQWTEWTEWSRCSASCDGGKRTRQRLCRNGDGCEGPAVDSRNCNDQACPSWSEWAEWGQCSASCGRGIQRRGRECQPKEGGECGGLASEYRECELRACPTWGDWEAWSSCSKSCGGGESIRRRECRDGVADDCRGPAVEHVLCNTQPCAAWAPWSDWSQCSKSCGEGSMKTRRRECRYNGLPSDDCPGREEDEAECRLGACPHWTEWTSWSQCSTSCGHGRQSRSRECRPNGFGCSGGDREVRFCQKAVCPYFDNWSEWGGCSVTCGRGFCERRRRCIKEGDLGKKLPTDEADEGEEENEKENAKEKENEGSDETENESEQPSRGNARGRGGGKGGRKGGGSGTTLNRGRGNLLPEDITAADSLLPQTLQVAQSAATVPIDRRRSPLIASKLNLRDSEGGNRAGATNKGRNGKAAIGGPGDCIGPEAERKPCDAGPCCEWGTWTAWSNCRTRCGNSGFRERWRSCEYANTQNSDNFGGSQSQQQQAGRFGGFGGGSSLFAPRYPFNGGSSAAPGQCPACIGDARQSESCAIPEEGASRSCKDEKPNGGRGPKLKKAEEEEEEENGAMNEQQQQDEYGGGVDLVLRDEAKRETALGAKCAGNWTEWGKWTECKECKRKRRRQCLGGKIGSGGHCPCKGKEEEIEHCEEKGGRKCLDEEESCYWTEWAKWSECDAHTFLRNRTRMCAGLRALANNCQCQGPLLEQIPCPPPKNLLRTVAAANSLIKRLQLIPRHKPSNAEKEREEEKKRRKSGEEEEEECGGEGGPKWIEWGEWGECNGGGGKCGGQEGSRNRTRECSCKRGCAGIAVESISCQMPEC